jgi:CBS domain-containing protein
MKVSEAMTRFPAKCMPDTPLRIAAHMMLSADCGAIPVVGEDDFPIGIITDRDIAIRGIGEGLGPDTHVRQCMTIPATTVTEETDLRDCIEQLEARQIRRAVVVDTSGRCTGMIAQADIASNASKRKAGELVQEVSKPPSSSTEPVEPL